MKRVFLLTVILWAFITSFSCLGKPSSQLTHGNKSVVPTALPTWEKVTEIGFGSVFISSDGIKIATIKDNNLVSYDNNGNLLWSVPLGGGIEGGPLGFDASESLNTICIALGQDTNHFQCFDSNGNLLFSYNADFFTLGVNTFRVSGSGNYIAVLQDLESFDTTDSVTLLDRQGNRLWEGNTADGMDFAISYDANFIEADDKVYNRSGQLVYSLNTDPWVHAVPPAFSRNEMFLTYSWGSRHEPPPYTHFDFRSAATGQLLWRKDELIFFSAISDNGEKIAATGPKGLFIYDTQGNQIFYHNPGYLAKWGYVKISSNGRIVATTLRGQRELLPDPTNPKRGKGWGPAATDLLVVDTVTAQILYQENLGDIGIPEIALSGDGTKLVISGSQLLKFYDLTNVVLPAGLKGGMKPPPPGGG